MSNLSNQHRDALAVLALVPFVTSISHWQELARTAGVTDDRGRGLHGNAFRMIAEELVRRGAARASGKEHVIAPELMPAALENAAQRRTLERIARALIARNANRYYASEEKLAAEGRAALAMGDAASFARVITEHPRWGNRIDFLWLLGLHAPLAWVGLVDSERRSAYLGAACSHAFLHLATIGDAVLSAASHHEAAIVRAHAASLLALRGDVDRALGCVGEPDVPVLEAARGFIELTRGAWSEARRWLSKGSSRSKGKRVELPAPWSAFDLLLAATDDAPGAALAVPPRLEKARRHLDAIPGAIWALEALVMLQTSGRVESIMRSPAPTWIEAALATAVATWSGQKPASDLAALREQAKRAGCVWVVERLEDLEKGIVRERSLLALRANRASWELALDALEQAVKPSAEPAAAKDRPFVTWTVDIHRSWLLVSARLGTARSAGREVSMGKLLEDTSLLEERDVAIARAIEQTRHAHMLPSRLVALFADHPRVRNREGSPIDVILREPELHVESSGREATIELRPSRFDENGMAIEIEGNTIHAFRLTPEAARLRAVIGDGLRVPKAGLSRMGVVLASLAAALPVKASGKIVSDSADADARTRVQLFRTGSGLRARLRVVPAPGGAALRPGVPPIEVVVPSDSGLRRVTRDLDAERAAMESLLDACPTFSSLPMEGDDRLARDLDTCLELLLELGATSAVLEWPEGQPLRVPTLRKPMRIQVSGDGRWLEVGGSVEIDEQRILSMSQLLSAASKARGRFVPIGDDEFLALTEDVRSKLDALGRLHQLAPEGRLSGALLAGLDGVLDGFDVEWSKQLEERRDAIERAERTEPALPRGLEAELRDYQRAGFQFLARRTDAKLGACLADDMGLGKTVQAIALLLHRKRLGPQLVVAPKSVLRNWREELARFAPSLSVRTLDAELGAKKGDVVITTYGLLGRLPDDARWATVVFDEAHALKNSTTQRWAAARAITADAVIGLTGTPMENHLGELHSIFELLVPGMLGTPRAFDTAFGSPGSTKALRRIVRPFILRRTKSQVLTELPPKTEMVRLVPQSPDHLAFYEAVRRRAAQRVESLAEKRAHIEILAEITRLRRAAIDPRLVGGDDAPAGAKIETLARLVSDLREEGHRALVFSQFLEVLDLAKTALDALGIHSRRLDGSMSAEKRSAEIDAFQRGDGDVFLLSLKAGGVGLNLTAADYVIHLDPWWNPAVEDQASDRAHRIGQERPVTIIRLVSEGTIEEKVLALHGTKRALADAVIGGADGAGTLDVAPLSELFGAIGSNARRNLEAAPS